MIMGSSGFEDQDYVCHWDGRSDSDIIQLNSGLPCLQSLEERMYHSFDLDHASTSEDLGNSASPKASDERVGYPHVGFPQGSGLSLSLGNRFTSDELVSSFKGEADSHVNLPNHCCLIHRQNSINFISSVCGGDAPACNYVTTVSQNTCRSISDDLGPVASVIQNSKYLKPAKELLVEAVNVCKGIEVDSDTLLRKELLRSNLRKDPLMNLTAPGEFSSPKKHDTWIRLTKLTALLKLLDSRYELYCHQMEEVISSFEVMAGRGAAKSYTALAVQAMSRHFSKLRIVINAQIRMASNELSEDIPRVSGSLSPSGLYDKSNRLKNAGFHQAWRPLRGLPEISVAILRAWLFEHFLHPYPNDPEKLMLASQTGLTRNQVSNWFINARVRLWKPMIEEMYKEEFGEGSMDLELTSKLKTCGGRN